MTRDMDLVRSLLLIIEERGDRMRPIKDVRVDGYSDAQIARHIWLLRDGGFIEAIDDITMEREAYWPRCLTWRGTEFLDAVRRQDIWEQTLDVARRGGTESLGAMFEIAKTLVRKRVEKLLQLNE